MTQFEMPTLMMVAHGNSGNGGDPAGALATKVAPLWDGRVAFGYMRSQPSLSDQFVQIKRDGDGDRLIVFPLFFSEGYLVFQELPKKLLAAGLDDAVVLPPAINLPGFTEMVANHVHDALNRRAWSAAETSVFLVPHGLKTLTEALPETVRFGNDLSRLCGAAEVVVGNIEGHPSLADWRDLGSRKNALIIPMLAGGGTHARDDLPELISARPGEEIEVLEPIGQWEDLPALVVEEANRHVARFGRFAVPLGPTGHDLWAERMARSA
ncbi:cobalamin biosynthesis protein CbiX [Thalassospira lucentensis]|uniref:cobalamin biosynthesis protein CbiX n=1 Tax=Thalassospira lucentensis TaxID=168935 RepID=UPI00142DBCCC|nr:cobalamin biosynthesis protein CbiX [Thalassospira lucentensis]NIZ00643.1 cobalamin biosynthesis protein CbiX [Thalassospira lucentensis]